MDRKIDRQPSKKAVCIVVPRIVRSSLPLLASSNQYTYDDPALLTKANYLSLSIMIGIW